MLRPIFAAIGLATALTGCVHQAEPTMSWGKPGVGFDQYRDDAVECAIEGATIPVADTEEYGEIDRGLKTQQRILEQPTGDQFDQIRDYGMTYQRNIRANVTDIQAVMVKRVEICLRQRDYKRFFLTPDQDAALAKLAKGSERRFRYLHSLAADPANIQPDLPESFDR